MAGDHDALIDTLRRDGGWVESKTLAEALGVTTRTVRNRVKRINEAAGATVIESSYRGYRLSGASRVKTTPDGEGVRGGAAGSGPNLDLTPQQRSEAVLRVLLQSEDGVSVYDLAERFFVSDSTIEGDLRSVRASIRPYDLALERRRDVVRLAGTERDLRRLMGHMVAAEQPERFTAQTGGSLAALGIDTTRMARMVADALQENGFAPDDFGINNILVHLVVMLNRIEGGNVTTAESSAEQTRGTAAHKAAERIATGLAHDRHLEVPEPEVDYLALVIATNGGATGPAQELGESLPGVVGDDTMRLTRKAVHSLEQAYHLPPFDDDFITRISVHIHGLVQRGTKGIVMHNPLTEQIKTTYPLIYDMAVFLAEKLVKPLSLSVNEDEIALFAFHIGASLEKSSATRSLVACDFLFLEYHDLYRVALDRIEGELAHDVRIAQVARVADYDPEESTSDLVLTPMPVQELDAARQVLIHPLLTDADMQHVRDAVRRVKDQRQTSKTLELIRRFLSPRLFHNEYYRASSLDMIRSLAAECAEAGFCDASFADQAIQREQLSPTEYHNRVALPHTLAAVANRSFLAAVVNRKPMRWHDEDVNIVLLMGIAESDRSAFRELFDSLLEVLSESANVNRLVRTSGYDNFAATLCSMIEK